MQVLHVGYSVHSTQYRDSIAYPGCLAVYITYIAISLTIDSSLPDLHTRSFSIAAYKDQLKPAY